MKAFIALVCLVAVAMAQETSTPRPGTSTPRPTPSTPRPTPSTPRPTRSTPRPTSSARPPTTVQPTTTTEPPVDCDISVDDDDSAILIPNPKSCETYYVCDAGVPILMICPEGLHFNPELLVCDWPAEAKCVIDEQEIGGLLRK